ncbi:N-acetylornithine carbamoyltransferase [Sorangium sp. So ce124]|uniref:N-acetylornithine carbamoyltransferase n=1 Tax=Sorangium sp. So ce124 TaxID=3133280 RepID=UPI003F637655
MRHFLTTMDYTRAEIEGLLERAQRFKRRPIEPRLKDRTIALVFFNPSLRTRTSFDVGIRELGGHAVVLEPGRGAWPIEFEEGIAMDGEPEEHIQEVARVLSRYADLIGVRAFPKFQRWEDDRQDKVLQGFARYATVPVVNLETITHPCQELALALAMKERLGRLDGKKFVLTWTYHPRPLNTAVANSAVLIASKLGMDVTLLCPSEEYHLDERYLDAARKSAADNGQKLSITYDIKSAYEGAHVVYAKSWGAIPYFGRWEQEKPIRDRHKHFIVDEQKMALTAGGLFSHCLPVRRNVKVTDAVIDSPASMVIDEAENRLHVQKAVMDVLANGW